jgi:uncharacterized membrane protein
VADRPAGETSSTGLDVTLAAMLAYAGGWITGLVFLALEKQSAFVRFHARQSTLTFLPLFLAIWLLPLWILLWPLSVALWLLLMFKALQGEHFKLPIVGELANRGLEKR